MSEIVPKQEIQQGHNRQCHGRIFVKADIKHGRDEAKRLRIKSEGWEARIRILEQQEDAGTTEKTSDSEFRLPGSKPDKTIWGEEDKQDNSDEKG